MWTPFNHKIANAKFKIILDIKTQEKVKMKRK